MPIGPGMGLNSDSNRSAAADPALQGICPLCRGGNYRALFASTDRLYCTTDRVFQIVECSRCGLMRLSPRPNPEELKSYYPADYWFAPKAEAVGRLEDFYRRLVVRDHVKFVHRALTSSRESGLILDVGCGGGLFLRMLRELGYAAVGLDSSLGAAGVAWKNNGAPAVCASLVPSPFMPNTCAAITMFHVLEHLYDPQSYLEEARTLLRPNGRLIVQVPNAACWQFVLLRDGWSGLDVPRHLLDFRVRDLEALLGQAGFEILERKHFSLRDNPAGFATSLAPRLDPMARRIRGVRESQSTTLFKSILYFCLVVASLPFAVLEAACHAGSTIMVEARKKH